MSERSRVLPWVNRENPGMEVTLAQAFQPVQPNVDFMDVLQLGIFAQNTRTSRSPLSLQCTWLATSQIGAKSLLALSLLVPLPLSIPTRCTLGFALLVRYSTYSVKHQSSTPKYIAVDPGPDSAEVLGPVGDR